MAIEKIAGASVNALTDATVYALIASMERQQAAQLAVLVETVVQLRARVDSLGALICAERYKAMVAS